MQGTMLTKVSLSLLRNCSASSRSVASSSGGHVKLPPPPAKLKALQEKFQKDDGVPVYLKGGMFDRFLFSTTIALTFVTLGLTLHRVYKLVNGIKE